jgi:hypothetical protein
LEDTEVHIVSRILSKCLIKYYANTNSWITSRIFEDCVTVPDKKMDAKNPKILPVIVECAAYSTNTAFFMNIKIVFYPDNLSVSHSL